MIYLWLVVKGILLILGLVIGVYTICFFTALALIKIPALKKVDQLLLKILKTSNNQSDTSNATRNKTGNTQWYVYFVNEFVNLFGRHGLAYSSSRNKMPKDTVGKQYRTNTDNECSKNFIPNLADIQVSSPVKKLDEGILHGDYSTTKKL